MPRRGGAAADEFPLLTQNNLYAAPIRGDGNCLFNALSDQLYGHQGEHRKIRAAVIDQMRADPDSYKGFIDVSTAGGVRRNPKRKNAGSFATQVSTSTPTDAEITKAFENHCNSMAQNGTYADNLEICAFSAAYGVQVKIFRKKENDDYSEQEDGFHNRMLGVNMTGKHDAPTVYIALHNWEHYSSVRNIAGPHEGPPNLTVNDLDSIENGSSKSHSSSKATKMLEGWELDIIYKSLSQRPDPATIKRVYEECGYDLSGTITKLQEAEERGSVSSIPDNSSIERDPDSDEEARLRAPNKKQDRRLSRATRLNSAKQAAKPSTPKDLPFRHSKLSETQNSDEKTLEEEDELTTPLPATLPLTPDPEDKWLTPRKTEIAETASNTSDETGSVANPSFSFHGPASQLSASSPNKSTQSSPPSTPPSQPAIIKPSKRRPNARESAKQKKQLQKAAAKKRKQQGRNVLQGVAVKVETNQGKTQPAPIVFGLGIRTLYI